MWIQFPNFLMILFVFLKSLNNEWVNNIFSEFGVSATVFLVVFTLLILTVIGWLDTFLGLRRQEQITNTEHNPLWMEMVERMRRIEKKLDL